MKPHRMRMTHNLLLHYGLYKEMEVYSFLIRWNDYSHNAKYRFLGQSSQTQRI
jgi:hypothetical protein